MSGTTTYRATEQQVIDIMDPATNFTKATITPYLETANAIVTDKLTGAGNSAAIMIQIEKYLAAHIATMTEGKAEQEKIGEASVKYQGKTEMGLDFTSYGQMVKLLDPSGLLAAAGKSKPSITAIEVTAT